MSSGILVQVLMMLTTLAFTRLFSSEQFGELAFYASYGSIMAIIGGLRFDYINLQESIDDKFIGYLVSNICSVCLNTVLGLTLLLIDYFFLLLHGYNILFMFLFGLGYSLFHNLTQYYISRQEYRKFILNRLIQISSIFVIGLALYLASYNESALIFSYSFSQLLLGTISFVFITFERLSTISIQQITEFFYRYFNEAIKNTLISFMQYSTPLAPVIIGALIFSESKIGAYFVFSQMLSSPLSIIRRNLLIFLNGEFGSSIKLKTAIKEAKSYFTYVKYIILLGLFGLILIYYFDEDIVRLILGKQWVDYSYLLIPLLLYFLIDSILQPITTLLPLWGYVSYSMKIESLRFICILFALPIFTFVFNISFMSFLLLFIAIMILAYISITIKTIKLSLKGL